MAQTRINVATDFIPDLPVRAFLFVPVFRPRRYPPRVSNPHPPVEEFTEEERAALAPYFTNVDRPVFALVNLPEVVKGALFARYSRSPKSLRRLFLDEFHARVTGDVEESAVGAERAEKLYEKVFLEYGDDSVAQLGGVHLACEGSSNILTKVLEWGRLMAYLEQSTRYVPYTQKPGGRWKYVVPVELDEPLAGRYEAVLDRAFETYADLLEKMQDHFRERFPRQEGESTGVYKRTIRAKALDAVRGLLPAATCSNVGIYGTGQAYEALLLRMRASPLEEVRRTADAMLEELREVIPAFVKRVDLEDRGVAWSRYLEETRAKTAAVADGLLGRERPLREPEVVLTDFDPDGEEKVVTAALYAVSNLPESRLRERVRKMGKDDRLAILEAYVGDRRNRRHKPGRAFERTSYRFDILSDYGGFRDLQRHRLLTLEWQRLSTDHGYEVPADVEAAGQGPAFREVMEEAARLHDGIRDAGLAEVAPYAVPMAYRLRYYMEMNAREAMHVIELRTTPQGHPAYRRICQTMHRLIADEAGHEAIADAMRYADHTDVDLARLEAERRTEAKRRAEGAS
jgi:thymidylate synthase ThyX